MLVVDGSSAAGQDLEAAAYAALVRGGEDEGRRSHDRAD